MAEYRVISPVADIHGMPDSGALRGKFETQLVLGEVFIIEEEKNGWCKGACGHDGYAGYVEKKHLEKSLAAPTHIVTAARSHTYQNATIKSPLVNTLSFGSLIECGAFNNGFVQAGNREWIYHKHISPISALDKDYAATARKFLETPYYWGGRSGFGIDCSGLVQVSLARAGIAAGRDSGMQETTLGAAVDSPRSSDIVFFQGHVGIMIDDQNIIHANTFHMKVTIEPLYMVAERSRGITSIRRL